MPDFGLFVVRPPDGAATIAAFHQDRFAEAKVKLRRLQSCGFLVKPLTRVSVTANGPETAQPVLQVVVNTMFQESPYRPQVSVVW